jgi:hypothetical protein
LIRHEKVILKVEDAENSRLNHQGSRLEIGASSPISDHFVKYEGSDYVYYIR